MQIYFALVKHLLLRQGFSEWPDEGDAVATNDGASNPQGSSNITLLKEASNGCSERKSFSHQYADGPSSSYDAAYLPSQEQHTVTMASDEGVHVDNSFAQVLKPEHGVNETTAGTTATSQKAEQVLGEWLLGDTLELPTCDTGTESAHFHEVPECAIHAPEHQAPVDATSQETGGEDLVCGADAGTHDEDTVYNEEEKSDRHPDYDLDRYLAKVLEEEEDDEEDAYRNFPQQDAATDIDPLLHELGDENTSEEDEYECEPWNMQTESSESSK